MAEVGSVAVEAQGAAGSAVREAEVLEVEAAVASTRSD